MRILITGSSGHLGEALVRVLKKMNHQVMGIDIVPSSFTHKVGSISDRQFVKQCVEGVDVVLHTATLHKPHVVTHSHHDFVDTNITGTLNLLEEAHSAGVKSFVFTSTTSVFGDALTPPPGAPAAWITEGTIPVPKNIYGVTKTSAEDLCQLFYRNYKLPCLVLRTSRFFPEEDDKKELRQAYEDANIKVNELLYRRVDIEDVVGAHILAMEKAPSIGFARYIISATTPFSLHDLNTLQSNAPAILREKFPDYEEVYSGKGWKMFPGIDRVYVNDRARAELGWQPKYDFHHVLENIKAGGSYQSPLSVEIGSKGYHSHKFKEGPYPVQ